MNKESSINQRIQNTRESIHPLRDHKLEALKSLTILLLREVEFLQMLPRNAEEVIGIDRINLFDRTQQFEKDLIRAALIKTNGSQKKAAELLGTKISTLNVKIKRYGIEIANQHSRSAAASTKR